MRVSVFWVTTFAAVSVSVGGKCGPPPGPSPATQTQTQTQTQTPGGDASSPFPPPPVEIDPGGGKITWMDSSGTLSVANGDSNNRVADEFTWKTSLFNVTDASGKVQTNVNYISIVSDGKEFAVIRRVGGQLHWTVLGDIPEICSRYDVTAWIPACANGGKTTGNRGIPSVLIDLPNATIKGEWKTDEGKIETGDVTHVYITPRTCPPY
jgi:hypothetical protein